MCGFAGYFSEKGFGGNDPIQTMTNVIRHRGPDDEGIYKDGPIALGFRRLSIIDLSQKGHQPMQSVDGNVCMVLNGEIYNFKDLRSDLEKMDVRFKSESDTEVVLKLYQVHGDSFPRLLRGMFAIALWDRKQKKLILVRDRIGKKPLYYFQHENVFAFASEIKSIVAGFRETLSVDSRAIEDFFTFGYIHGPKTIYDQIRKLDPGHSLILQEGHVRIEPYWTWTPPQTPLIISEEDAKSQLMVKLEEAVRLRMISDVPLGAFLSGGVDSSAIVALMSRFSEKPVKTFSIGFGEANYDESQYARIIAGLFQTEHHEEIVNPNYAELIDAVLSDFDEPFGDSSSLPTYVVSKLTRQHVTVALSGDGGDEVFAGYHQYPIGISEAKWDRIPVWMRKFIKIGAENFPDSFAGVRTIDRLSQPDRAKRFVERYKLFLDKEKNKLLLNNAKQRPYGYDPSSERIRYFESTRHLDFLTQMQYNDIKTYLVDDIMVKVDRMSMLNSLETRSPFLDHEIVEYAFSLPSSLHMKNGVKKYLLKETFRGILPGDILDRPKQGFALPLRKWLNDELYDFSRDHIFSNNMKNIVDLNYVEKLYRIHRSGLRDMSYHLWLLLTFSVFLNRQKI